MFSQRRSHYWSQQSRTFFFKGFSAKQQKKPKKAANYSVIEQNALSDKHPKMTGQMTGQTRVWPVKPTIKPDIVRWPAVILSPAVNESSVTSVSWILLFLFRTSVEKTLADTHYMASKFPRGFLCKFSSFKQRTYYKWFIMQRYGDIYLLSVWSFTMCFEET